MKRKRNVEYDIFGNPLSSYNHKLEAALLAIVGGCIGMHKFYLGKMGQGLIYLIFCWTFIPAIIGFVEGLRYIFMSKKNFDIEYNSHYL